MGQYSHPYSLVSRCCVQRPQRVFDPRDLRLVTHIKGLGEKRWVTLRWSSPMVSPPYPRSHRGCTDKGPSRPEQAGSNHLGWRRRAAGPGCHLPRAGAPGKTCRADRSPAVGRTRHKAGKELQTGLHSSLRHREGSPTCSLCRTLLARRSNTTRLWSSLPEMICLSSASTASTALECSLRLFTRAKPAGM